MLAMKGMLWVGVVGAESTDYISHKIHQQRQGRKNNNLKGLKSLGNIFLSFFFFICS